MVKIIIAGDFAPRARVAQLIESEQYTSVFSEVKQYISLADYSIVNLETPIVCTCSALPISKFGPNLRCTDNAVRALKYVGFNLVTLANNHINDYGNNGIKDTITACNEMEIEYVGIGNDLEEASQIFFKTINGLRIAFINCCESEFSIATKESSGANPLNPIKQYYDIIEARKHADKVIVIVHGGHEHFQLPSPRMKELYRFYADVGADVVINHHQHCYSGYERYNGSLIFYGLGNFCFDIDPIKVDTGWNLGYMVELCFDKTVSFNILPYRQCCESPKVEMLPIDFFDKDIEKLNSIILDDNMLKDKIEEYYNSCQNWECSILEPYRGKILNKLFSLGLLPKFVNGAKISQILNHVECESHRDKLIYALRKRLK